MAKRNVVHILYRVTCLVSGKSYIGLTHRSLEARWGGHLRDARRFSHLPLYKAIRKYGQDNFNVTSLASSGNRDDAGEVERLLIQQENTHAPHGYNITAGGDGGSFGTNRIFTETHRKKLSVAASNRRISDVARKGMSERRKGIKQSEETKNKRSASMQKFYGNRPKKVKLLKDPSSRGDKLRGRKRSKEVCEKISKGIRQSMTIERRTQISAQRKAFLAVPENREAMRAQAKLRGMGWQMTPEIKAKLAAAQKASMTPEVRFMCGSSRRGVTLSAETRAKIGATNRLRAAERRRVKDDASRGARSEESQISHESNRL
jgi:group I intron endonuclease